MFWKRATGRSDIIAGNAMVASSQPLATQAGLDIMRSGGNAIDAAIATAAVLDVVEPFSTGCGGDAFALIHKEGMHIPLSYNGSGRAGSLVSLEGILEKGWTDMPMRGGATVTVPGAMHLWCTLVENHGELSMNEILRPAISYARNGFPVSQVISEQWAMLSQVPKSDYARSIFTCTGDSPRPGDIMTNSDLADTFDRVGREGIDAFYTGDIAQSIVDTVQSDGGFLTIEDMSRHKTEETKAISTRYRNFDVYEHPPNGQGFAALMMLNIMENEDLSLLHPLSASRYHTMIEAKKLAYDELYRHNSDPDFYDLPLEELLSKDYAQTRFSAIEPSSVIDTSKLAFREGNDTVYLATADGNGNAVSLINSLYMGFGSGLVANGTGIKLQNRGNLFSLDPGHPNCYAPGKRPFHTIIPGALYRDGELFGVFGIMGGAHQAQAHAQFVSNIVDYEMSPQEALDFPRFNHNQHDNTVALENGVPLAVQGVLRKKGHHLVHETMSGFGGGQAIFRLKEAWIAGSDYRKDGQAAGY